MMNIPRKLHLKLTDDKIEQQLILRKGTSESYLHVLLKILAYIYFWPAQDFTIEPQFRLRKYKPDLIKMRPSELPKRVTPVVDTWVECKTVKIEKLIKLGRTLPHSDIYWFHNWRYFENNHHTFFSKRDRTPPANLTLIGVQILDRQEKTLKNSLTRKTAWLVKENNAREKFIILDDFHSKPVKIGYSVFY